MKDEFLPDYITIPYPVYRDENLEGADRVIYGTIYFFVHLKNRKCFASNNTLAEIAGVNERTVRNSLTRLEEAGYIRRTYKDAGRRHRTEIEALISYKALFQTERKARPDGKLGPSTDGNLNDHKKNSNKKKIKKNTKALAEPVQKVSSTDDSQGKQEQSLIDEFKALNPSYERLFRNKTQREALKRLIASYGVEKVRGAIRYAASITGEAYAPSITTPYELESKLAKLVDFKNRQTNKKPIGVSV